MLSSVTSAICLRGQQNLQFIFVQHFASPFIFLNRVQSSQLDLCQFVMLDFWDETSILFLIGL